MREQRLLAQLLAVCEEIRNEMRLLNARLESAGLEVRRSTSDGLMTSDEAYPYLRFASRAALYKAISVEGIPTLRRGRTLLFNRDALDRWLAGTPRAQLMKEARSRKRDE